MKLWKGIEMEGVMKGTPTLFIGSPEISFEQIERALSKHTEIEQLYFGAGNCTILNEEVIKKCLESFLTRFITAEIDINDLSNYDITLLNRIFLIITTSNKNYSILNLLDKRMVTMKLQSVEVDNKILLTNGLLNFEDENVSTLEGKKYKNDVVLIQ